MAELHVFEGQSHADYLKCFSAPESRDAFGEIAAFLDQHLEPSAHHRKAANRRTRRAL
jgi:acetyl esterase/lipase